MDVDELFAQLFQHRQRYGRVVDKRPTLRRRNLPADDGVLRIVVDVVVRKERLQVVARQVEMSLNDTSICPLLDTLRVCTLTQQQTYGAENNTLSCTRLTCQHREPRIQLYIQFINQRKILYI